MIRHPPIWLYALKRSGSHALVNWLLPQGNFHFYNNVAPVLLCESPTTQYNSLSSWQAAHLPHFVSTHLEAEKTRFIISIEDQSINYQPFPVNSEYHRKVILLLRSPANLFASRIRKAYESENLAYSRTVDFRLKRAVLLWKMQAREVLGDTGFLKNKLFVYFDLWVSSQAYRQQIASQLDIKFKDIGAQRVSAIGGGSSFDQTEFDGRGLEMNTQNRATLLNGDQAELLKQVLQDKELTRLNQRLVIMSEQILEKRTFR